MPGSRKTSLSSTPSDWYEVDLAFVAGLETVLGGWGLLPRDELGLAIVEYSVYGFEADLDRRGLERPAGIIDVGLSRIGINRTSNKKKLSRKCE